MINIVHFIHGLNMGGAETLVKEYALGINKDKFNLTVLCFDNLHSPYDTLLKEHKIKVVYICDYMFFYGKKNLFYRFINLIQRYYLVRKILKKVNPDILHIHIALNKMAKFANLQKKTKIFYTQHFDVTRYKKNYPDDIKALKWLIKNYRTQLIALNDSMRQELNELFNVTNTVVLNNGINVSRFKNHKAKDAIRAEIGIPKNAFVLGHIGRFNRIKNHFFLIDIAEQILKQNSNTWLLLIGDGNYLQEILQKIKISGLEKQTIILHNRTDIPDLLSAMDFFVFPSLSEGLPISCIEAQIAGVYCVVSNAVPKVTQISNLITYKSLKEPVENWVKEILKPAPLPVYKNLDEWDISVIIKKLEELYEK